MLPIEKLQNYRGLTIQKLLRPIAKVDTGPAWRFAPSIGHVKVLGTHDGSIHSDNFSEWRFASIVPRIFIMYYELWKLAADNQCFIERAYLQIYKVNKLNGSENEIVCLHCDPNEPKNSKLYIYKCIPHIHMRTAEHPLNHSHIPLALGQDKFALKSVDTFDNFLSLSIQFIHDEILGRLHSLK